MKRALVTATVLVLLASGCPKPAAAPGGAPGGAAAPKEPAPVKVAAAELRSMPVELENIATVEPIATVEIKAQVSGEIIAVLFKEGDMVTEGQELFHIDPRPFEAALKMAEAKLARAEAMQEEARAELARTQAEAQNMKTELGRNKTLLDREMVTREEYDTARTAAAATGASVDASAAGVRSAGQDIRSAEAEIERAKLDLAYCVIRAPMTGRTGALNTHKGDLVRENDAEPMISITQLKPIYVSFTLPERFLTDLRRRTAEGPLTVRATVPDHDDPPVDGTLTFVDNQVDLTTSTIRLKATFPNEDEYFWPGQYVRAAVQMAVQNDVVTVPSQAVQTGQKGTYVYVVGADLKAEMRLVKAGIRKEGFTVIVEGLSAGEKLVIDGHMRVAPDQAVSIITDEAAAEAAPAEAAAEAPKP